jgi:retron-type reverse transcriptase
MLSSVIEGEKGRGLRDAHQAMDDISLQLRTGKTQVIDADISKSFDSIPHDKLLALVAKRVVDENILRLIKLWLKAPVIEERKDGKKRTEGNPNDSWGVRVKSQ